LLIASDLSTWLTLVYPIWLRVFSALFAPLRIHRRATRESRLRIFLRAVTGADTVGLVQH
jgi:hypothetical protein